jgi:cysteinyl-tRNA synthetase
MDMDLKFPHHDNVMAQYKRLCDIPLWINNFFNIGHLTIEEIKMSNTLKNVVTIQEALANYPPQQIRLLFLLRSWSSTIEYSDDQMIKIIDYDTIKDQVFTVICDSIDTSLVMENIQQLILQTNICIN